LEQKEVISMCKDSIGSKVIDELIQHPSLSPLLKEKLYLKFQENLVDLSMNKFATFNVQHLFQISQVSTKVCIFNYFKKRKKLKN